MKQAIMESDFLPNYTSNEEKTNFISHFIGFLVSIYIFYICLKQVLPINNSCKIICCCVYGISMMLMFAVSSIYHVLRPCYFKRIMRVVDHCTINLFIAGTYTPILIVAVYSLHPIISRILFGAIWIIAVISIIFTSIDLKRFGFASMICYILMGWCIIFALKPAIDAMTTIGFMWLLAGGIFYTIGACLYKVGKRKKYYHFIFHIFVDIGCWLQALAILKYVF